MECKPKTPKQMTMNMNMNIIRNVIFNDPGQIQEYGYITVKRSVLEDTNERCFSYQMQSCY